MNGRVIIFHMGIEGGIGKGKIIDFNKERADRLPTDTKFNYKEEEVARNETELQRPGIKAYIGPFSPGIFKNLPDGIETVRSPFSQDGIFFAPLTIGGKKGKQLKTELQERGIRVGRDEQTMMERWSFGLSRLPNQENATLVKLKVKDFGFDSEATTEEIYQRAQEAGLELCPPEVGPEYCLAYADQPLPESLMIGMDDIKGEPSLWHENLRIFSLYRSKGGEISLGSRRSRTTDIPANDAPEVKWKLDDAFVFRLKKLSSATSE
jgi:hypothetical protein